jgi:hypothetical protein
MGRPSVHDNPRSLCHSVPLTLVKRGFSRSHPRWPFGCVRAAGSADSQVMGPQIISRKLAIAGWAVAVIAGGFGLLTVIGAAAGTFCDRSGRARITPGHELAGERPQVAAWTCSVSAFNCSEIEWISSVRSVFLRSKSA